MADRDVALVVERLEAGYGDIRAVWDLSLRVEPGQLVVLLGPNGVGKTSAVNAIAGLVNVSAGSVSLGGKDMLSLSAYQRSRAGLALVPEGRRVFRDLTVDANLFLGTHSLSNRSEADQAVATMYQRFPILAEKRRERAGSLSGGQQQMLAIAQALAARPRMLILDEPSAGLAPSIIHDVFQLLRSLADDGELGVLMVEQRDREALEVADLGHVLHHGRIVETRPGQPRPRALLEARSTTAEPVSQTSAKDSP